MFCQNRQPTNFSRDKSTPYTIIYIEKLINRSVNQNIPTALRRPELVPWLQGNSSSTSLKPDEFNPQPLHSISVILILTTYSNLFIGLKVVSWLNHWLVFWLYLRLLVTSSCML